MSDDILAEIKSRFKEAYDAVDQTYEDSLDDLHFFNGEQWPTDLKADREGDGRPCLVINKIPTFADQVIGDIRQNEPAIKVKPVDSKADPKTAEILTGLIRNIEVQNDAEIAYDTAAESAVICGIGAWRIGTDYSDDDEFDQDIKIYRIKNPFSIYWDPAAQSWDKSDARYCFITERLPREEFKKLYPKASLIPFESSKDRNPMWGDDKTVRVAEYFRLEPKKKTLYLIANDVSGETMASEYPPVNMNQRLVRTREVESRRVRHWKANQAEILEGPNDWPGKYIPIVMCYGKETNIENETTYRGIVRHAKDPQKLYNFARSTSAETISLAPKSPYLVTAKHIGNYQRIWDSAHKRNYPYLPYDLDPGNPAALPQRSSPVAMNTGIQNEVNVADQELHDTTGLQQASLGKKSNEKSGKAIIARQREGDVANFAYYDNLARALKYAGRVLVDLIPKIYDTARIIRILNPDGTDKFVPVNQPFTDEQGIEQIFNLTVGKYDVLVSIGPSYTSQREEAADGMINFLGILPDAIRPMIADLIVKNLDWPGAAEIEKRLKALLPPQLQEGGGANGVPPPAPAPPDPTRLFAFKKMEEEAKGAALDNEMKFRKMRQMEMAPDAAMEGRE